MLSINSKRLLASIDELSEFGSTDDRGITRICLTPSDAKAREFVAERLRGIGFPVSIDSVGNVFAVSEMSLQKEIVLTGSHTDSVVNGGRLDGNLGVLAAIEVASTLKGSGRKTTRALGVVDFSNEEGVRYPPTTGSKYFAGLLSREEIYEIRDSDGIAYLDAVRRSGLKTSDLPGPRDRISSFIELHIEQGPILEEEEIQIGIVESIVGIKQFTVRIAGDADHAGTTPMDLRRDSLVAASKIILEVDQLAKKIGNGAVGTVGRIAVLPGAPNVIPGSAELTIDFRHTSSEVLGSLESQLLEACNKASNETKTEVNLTQRAELEPAKMSPEIIKVIEESVSELGLSSKKIQSGAGHDSMIISKICNCGMIFVPSARGKSHSPLEFTKSTDLVNGGNVLLNTVLKLLE